ncbi:hypothetical protein ACLB2K_022396 [Fragaria x ananassa]
MDDQEDSVSLLLSLDQWQGPPDSDDSDPLPTPSSSYTYMLGFLIANIVGIQYYSGTITGCEMVGLVREPLNPYNSNTIRVLNTRTVQVSHIELAVAAALALALLIDAELIAVEE